MFLFTSDFLSGREGLVVESEDDTGQQEEEQGKVSVRSRFAGDEGQKDLADFIKDICEEIRTKEIRKVTVEEQK